MKVQERISKRDTALNLLTQQLNDLQKTENEPTTKSQTDKCVNKLEVNVSKIFQTNNDQQTCMDEINDDIEMQVKAKKWMRDKITQIKNRFRVRSWRERPGHVPEI